MLNDRPNAVERGNLAVPYPLTSVQMGVWMNQARLSGSPYYNIGMTVAIEGELDVSRMETAIQRVCNEHAALRLVIGQDQEGPVQKLLPYMEAPVSHLDISLEEDAEQKAQQMIHEAMNRSFHLSDDSPLWECLLIRVSEQKWCWLSRFHHIICDGFGGSIFYNEVCRKYTILCHGGNCVPEDAAPSFFDFLSDDEAYLASSRIERDRLFWKERFPVLPSPLLPANRRLDESEQGRSDLLSWIISRKVFDEVLAYCGARKESVSSFFLALFACYFARTRRFDEVVIGVPVHNRPTARHKHTIGMFASVVPIGVKVSFGATFGELMDQVAAELRSCYRHQRLSVSEINRCLNVVGEGRDRIYDVSLSFNGFRGEAMLGDIPTHAVRVQHRDEQIPLAVYINEYQKSEDVVLEFSYGLKCLSEHSVERIRDGLALMLQHVLVHPEEPVEELPLMDSRERDRVLQGFNATQAEYPREALIHELFEAQVQKTPEAVAVVYEGEKVTYAELNAKANQLAYRLREEGVGPDVLVAISVERSLEMVVGLLGILKAGGAYVPVDPEYPQDRIKYMLEDSAAPVLLTQRCLVESLPSTAARTLLLDEEKTYAEQPQSNLDRQTVGATSRNLAYVIYTSGSTGLPKGVMVEHRNLANLVSWHCSAFWVKEGSVSSSLAGTGFDASTWELWPGLCVGGTVCLLPAGKVRDPEAMLGWWQEQVLDMSFLPTPLAELAMARNMAPKGLDTLLVGGDRLNVRPGKDVSYSLINNYGPTESTVVATSGVVGPVGEDEGEISIGRPIANTRVYILDERSHPVPLGVAGEIHIGGEGVARGYLNRPELTAESFVKDPFVTQEGARMYRTGDLGRWREDGTIEYLGRNDDQVKIRGFRIELGEIEARILEVPGVREAVVLAREDVPGDKRLVAYWTQADEGQVLEIESLREHLKAELPGYMVPSAFVRLEAMPLTPNGKVDRKALPAPDASALVAREYEAPQGQTEEVLAGIWQELLGVEKVGRHDSFFDLGGHSLLAVQLLARMRQVLGQEISLKELFDAPTLAEVAARLQQADASLLAPIEHADHDRPLLLSWAQQRLWFLEQMEDLGTTYHMPAVLRLQGRLDVQALQGALDAIVARHEALRTVFVQEDGGAEPVQVIRPEEGCALNQQDLSALEAKERRVSTRQALRQAMQEKFNLSQGPLIRGLLLKLQPEEHVLLLEMHHIVSDGWSMGVLVRELSALYEAFAQGQADPLPALPIQYADYAQWQRQWLTGERLGEQLAFWQTYLQGAPELLELPTDHPRPAVQSHAGAILGFELDSQLVQGLKALATRHGATLFMVLQAGWSVLLGRLAGQDDVVIGTPVANRRRSELEGLIGFFVNTLALRTRIDAEQTVAGLLQTVRQQTLSAFGHQDVPFEQVVEAVQPARSLAHSPLFQVMLVLQNTPEAELRLPGLTLRQQDDLEWDTTHFDLTLSVSEAKDGSLAGVLQYCSDLFEKETVERWLGHLRVLLAAMVADDARPVAELPWLTSAEREQVLDGFNATQAEYPREVLIHELFEAQVQRTPEAVAVVYEGEHLTYAELNTKANQLAHRLRQEGVGQDVLVAISVERSLEMVVGLLGILKAGGAYVPVDPEYPEDRIVYMLVDSAAPVLLTQKRLEESLPSPEARTTLLLDEEETYAGQPRTNPGRQDTGITSRNLAYVIYTSGSTGLPKGVMVEHQGVCNLAQAQGEAFAVDTSSRVLQFASLSFDACVSEIVVTLSHGAQLHLGSTEVLMPGEPLLSLLEDRRITHVTLPPAALGVMESVPELESLRTLVVAGEACPIGTARAWSQGRRFVNAYGPTEATVCATMQVIDDGLDEAQSNPPIGRPIANARIYILDERGQPVPLGVAGEIHIGGDGVARGYLNRPELTAERFVEDPFSGKEDARMYRTGDLGRWHEDGTIEYLGRNDDQVKIRGFRIELGEIEARILEVPGVREAVVLAREDVPGDKRLVAYWTQADEGQVLEIESLREHLKAELPGYMVPSAFVRLEAMPLTPNGKVDRKALPAPDASALVAREYEAPQGQTEEVLAAIWQELLGVEKVGRHDSFFDLGGHSLLITQVVSQVNEKLGVDVPVRMLFEHSSLKDLADAIDSRKTEGGQDGSAGHVVLVNLDDEVVLDSTIHASEALAPAVALDDARSVLLTGATGFLGVFLLRDLVQQSRAQVYCLVRADDESLAMERIIQGLAKYDLWDESMRERIVPVCGDLGKPMLGLGATQFESLADDVDLIVHNGAWVNFLYPYEVLKDANVLGTQEVLRLATHIRLKPVHYVSTISVFPACEHMRRITESTEPDSWKGLQGGYPQSKWVAEKLMFLAAKRGIPVFIHRPGSISGDTLHGACPTHDLIFRLIKTCAELGMAPDVDDSMNMAPVDYVSAAIVHMAKRLPADGTLPLPRVSHLVNPRGVSLDRFYEMVSDLGYPVRLVTADQWYSAMLAAARGSEEHALHRFLPMLSAEEGQGASDERGVALEMHQPEFECVQTQVMLDGSGVMCPELDEALLTLYFEYFERTGFLHRRDV